MLKLLLRACISGLRSRQKLTLENLALRHQIEVLQRTAGRPRLRTADRALWVILSRICRDWRRKSRPQRAGRPLAEPEVRALIRRLSQQNPPWGAPRIHGELLKLGYEIVETTVAKYMIRRPGPPSQSWHTFVRNHLAEIVGASFI
jgi:putative transposase